MAYSEAKLKSSGDRHHLVSDIPNRKHGTQIFPMQTLL
jgi:hypothetical protein